MRASLAMSELEVEEGARPRDPQDRGTEEDSRCLRPWEGRLPRAACCHAHAGETACVRCEPDDGCEEGEGFQARDSVKDRVAEDARARHRDAARSEEAREDRSCCFQAIRAEEHPSQGDGEEGQG